MMFFHEKTEKFKSKYPEFFRYFGDINNINIIPWPYVECGWENLIDRMCQEITEFIKNSEYGSLNSFYWAQIKEKYGTGRFYYEAVHPSEDFYADENQAELDKFENFCQQIDDIIRRYEIETQSICEICEEVGELKAIRGWYSIRCNKCRSKEETNKSEKV